MDNRHDQGSVSIASSGGACSTLVLAHVSRLTFSGAGTGAAQADSYNHVVGFHQMRFFEGSCGTTTFASIGSCTRLGLVMSVRSQV